MAHFVELDENNVVLRVIVVHNNELLDANGVEQEALGQAFCTALLGGNWKQTSYSRAFRKNYAGRGFFYDVNLDAFIPPQFFPSWILDLNTYQWSPPVPYPTDGEFYAWDEATQTWVLPNAITATAPR
jgi:hypothetical protein